MNTKLGWRSLLVLLIKSISYYLVNGWHGGLIKIMSKSSLSKSSSFIPYKKGLINYENKYRLNYLIDLKNKFYVLQLVTTVCPNLQPANFADRTK